jgi:3-methyladenine DNA glycosylase AlkD
MNLAELHQKLHQTATASQAAIARRFFKTGPGEYGEGDRFLGVKVPQLRAELPHTDALSEADVLNLLHSEWHEERLLALLVLGRRFSRAKKDATAQQRIVTLYLANTQWINNWDLVDSSAPHILGAWLLRRDRTVLDTLATSTSLWEQRIAILATQTFIRSGDFADTLRLSALFLSHPHDLMHKACGWMLREVGNRDVKPLLTFLDTHASKMPRTMLRYAIEKLPEKTRQAYLAMKS